MAKVEWSVEISRRSERNLEQILAYLSINEHIESLSKGVIDSEDIIYYLCFIAVFLFLTLRSLEANRWR